MITIINNHTVFILIAIFCSFWVTWYSPSIMKYHSFYEGLSPRIFHQYLLNLSGCILGWIALYYFLFQRAGETLSLTDLIIALVAFIGIAGYLPHLVINKGFKP